MASDQTGKTIVIMGVSGAGKSTIGEMLAKEMNCTFIDADDFHPQSNKEKMSNGIPLSDSDRKPWLETIRDILRGNMRNRKCTILGCSALKRAYRDVLRSSDEEYEMGRCSKSSKVKFVLLDAPAEVIASRLEKRAIEGMHFMPAKLLKSQIELLDVDDVDDDDDEDDSEGIFKADATLTPRAILGSIQAWGFF